MIKFLNLTALSMLLMAITSNSLSAKGNIEEKQAVEIVKSFVQTLKDQDVEQLEALLDANYTHIHGTGLIENKQDFINALKNKTRIYNVADVSDIKITQLGNVAYATAKLNIKVTTPKATLEAINVFTIIMHTNKKHKNMDKNNKDKAKSKNNITIANFQATKVG